MTATLPLGLQGCVYVQDLYTRVLGGNTCLTEVTLDLGSWEGHPLFFRGKPW